MDTGISASFSALAPHWPLSDEATAALVSLCLAEDVGSGDVTSKSLFDEDRKLAAIMQAREDIRVCGLAFAAATFWALSEDIQIEFHIGDGDSVEAGGTLMRLEGPARALLTAERTALNMVQHLSGISTLVNTYNKAIEGTGATLLDTRKTTPGLRYLEKYAVRMGGGTNHRMGLYDAIMIKDNHIAAVGSITQAVAEARAKSQLMVQVECDTLEQVAEAITAGADSLLLDNMTPSQLREAVTVIDGRAKSEASGGIRLDTIRDYAETGISFISVGRLTQSAPAVDIGLDFTEI